MSIFKYLELSDVFFTVRHVKSLLHRFMCISQFVILLDLENFMFVHISKFMGVCISEDFD